MAATPPRRNPARLAPPTSLGDGGLPLSFYEMEETILTKEIPIQWQSNRQIPSSVASSPTVRNSLRSSIFEFDPYYSKNRKSTLSCYSTQSFPEVLMHPKKEQPPGYTPSIPKGNQPAESDALGMSTAHKIAFVCVACLAQFLNLCGMNQTVAPVMVLAKYFNIDNYGTLSWFSAAYSMTVGTFILPAGKPFTCPSPCQTH
jgi:hypothetical protein